MRTLIGIRPDGGIELELTSSRWARSVGRLRGKATAAQQPMTIAGKSALVRRRGETLEIHLPGRARLLVESGEVRLIAEARAMDLGGAGLWGERYLNWATEVLTGDALGGLANARAFGWRLVELPLCSDFDFVLSMAEARRERWVGVTKKTPFVPHAGEGDDLATLYIGGPRAALYVRGYLKSRQMANCYAEDSTLHERLREGGWDGGPFFRLEGVLREEGLVLRDRGGQVVHDFTDPATLADPIAWARLWAHMFGHPEAPDSTGRYRLLAQGSNEIDPRWRAVQLAAAEAPVESLAQVRARRVAEMRERKRIVHDRWVKSVGEMARLDGYTPSSRPIDVAEHIAARTREIDRHEITGAMVRADALLGDLMEEESR